MSNVLKIISILLMAIPLIGTTKGGSGSTKTGKPEVAPPKQQNCDGADGLVCQFPDSCRIGETVLVNCSSRKGCSTPISRRNVEAICRFCWQLDQEDYDCQPVVNCSTSSTKLHRTTCLTHSSVICMGHREFYKNVRCNWSSGYSWAKTMILSVVLGGFGADRFYLGLWKSAVGKLFSFGGLGVWTIVDVILVAVGYIKPHDGSMYI